MSAALHPSVVFRRRSGWEAADLGILLWRKNLLSIIFFMGIPSALLLCAYAAIVQFGLEDITPIAAAFIWWIKPLLDRFGLQVISVRFFNQDSSFRDLFRGLGKTLRTGLLGDLLWRRFSLYRSARMPLLVLERPKRKTYKRRKQLLSRNGLGFGLPLTIICIVMSMALNFGELIFVQSMFNNFQDSYRNFFDFIGDEKLLVALVWYINMILIETLYVCMGFCLYINSRVETEGWDIELLFKTCVEKNERNYIRKTAPLVPVIVLLFLFTAKPAWTQQNTTEQTTTGQNTVEQNTDTQTGAKQNPSPEILVPASVSEESEETLETIFDGPEFGTEKPSKEIQFKKTDSPRTRGTRNREFSFPALKEMLGMILRFVLGAALAAAIGIGLYFAYLHRNRLFPARDGGKSRVDGNVLPDDPRALLQKAEELHRKGKVREAWALCFKAFTGIFTRRWFLSIPAEATEYETLALLRKKTRTSGAAHLPNTTALPATTSLPAPPLSGNEDCPGSLEGFERFVRQWIVFAYGGREPKAGSFEEALDSCRALMESGAGA